MDKVVRRLHIFSGLILRRYAAHLPSKSLPAMQRRRRSSMRRKIYTMAERTADGVTGVA